MLAQCSRKLGDDPHGLIPRIRSVRQPDHLVRLQDRLHTGAGAAAFYYTEASHGRPGDALGPECPAQAQTRMVGGQRTWPESARNKIQRAGSPLH